MPITPKVTHINGFTVMGLSVRTINRDEFNQKTAKLPTLWEEFSSKNIADKVINRVPHSPIFGVYSDYESDATGYYTVTAGVTVDKEKESTEWSTIHIPSGYYLVFENNSVVPQAVVETWQYVWNYFASQNAHQRNFNADFEVYRGTKDFALYIGIKSS
ncbi:GyrI-like domain-containing protein [Legionella nagasakiensis]|uniref:GyrI-like domain-containing protein n=1 Tax=Legionella nagasakiensis TaxID=535290 RepID=UPI001A94583C|nr:GyrI-like domain-containing protein [Legionella nagasakiensis]